MGLMDKAKDAAKKGLDKSKDVAGKTKTKVDAVVEKNREKLPDKPAHALDARLRSGGSEPDAKLAEELGMKKNTFLQNFTRARQLLVDCLKRKGIAL